MSIRRSFILRYKFTIVVAVTILSLSLLPGSSLPSISWGDLVSVDKWAHFIIYALLAFAWRFEWRGAPLSGHSWYRPVVIVAVSAVYGILLEAMQLVFNSGRYFEVLDIIANIIGSMAGLWFCQWLIKK